MKPFRAHTEQKNAENTAIFAFPLPPQIPNSHELPWGFAPQGPPPGAALDPLGTLTVPRPLAYPRRPH